MTKQKTPHVDHPRAVGERIKAARLAAGLSQRELAGEACSAAYISRLELGQRIPSIQLLRQLEPRLAVSADFLATGLLADASMDSQLLDAEVALRLDDAPTARRLYEELLADGRLDRGRRSQALAGLGRLALGEGRSAEARELLMEAVETSGLDAEQLPEIAESLARAYAAAGELSPAIALLERCVARYANAGDALQYIRFASLLGYALTDNGDLAGAERVVAEALIRGQEVAIPTHAPGSTGLNRASSPSRRNLRRPSAMRARRSRRCVRPRTATRSPTPSRRWRISASSSDGRRRRSTCSRRVSR